MNGNPLMPKTIGITNCHAFAPSTQKRYMNVPPTIQKRFPIPTMTVSDTHFFILMNMTNIIQKDIRKALKPRTADVCTGPHPNA